MTKVKKVGKHLLLKKMIRKEGKKLRLKSQENQLLRNYNLRKRLTLKNQFSDTGFQ